MTYKFKITQGSPDGEFNPKCNSTQASGSFYEDSPSAAERAEEGMATYNAYRAQNAKLLANAEERERKVAEEKRVQKQMRRMLRPDQLR